MTTETLTPSRQHRPWNKGRLIGQKPPLKPKDVWTIHVRLQLEGRRCDLAMFNLAIDSKLRGRDLVRLRIDDVFAGGRVRDGVTVIQKKTGRPVQFESPSKRAALSTSGWPPWVPAKTDTCSRAVSGSSRTSRHDSTRGSSIDGLSRPGLIVRRTARTRCAERSRLRFIERPATCGPRNCCSVTRSWKAPSDISVSRSTMRSAFRSKSSFC